MTSFSARTPLHLVAGFGLILVVGGCAAPSDTSSVEPAPSTPSESTESSSPSDAPSFSAAEIADLAALKLAVEGAGVECSDWTQDDATTTATGSGWCGAEWGLSTYASSAERNELLELNRSSAEPQTFLAGETWLVTRGYEDPSDLTAVQESIGGDIIEPGDPIPN
jgi:hypothetical protein